MEQQPSEQELIVLAVGGDRVAMSQLLLAQCVALTRHVAGKLPAAIRSTTDEEDIVGDAFVHAFRNIRGFQWMGEGSFLAWLKAIADRRLQDAQRAATRKKRGGGRRRVRGLSRSGTSSSNLLGWLAADSDTPSRAAARREAVQAVQVALASLPNDYRQAVLLHDIEGKKLDEVAATMNRSPGAVRGLLDRAKNKMRVLIGRMSRYFSKR